MFEGPVTGNIPEVLDNGEVTDGTHVTAGQLALADSLRSSNGPGSEHGSVRQQRSGHPVPGRQGHRRAGLKAGQQRAGAGDCASSNGGGPGHHGRAGGRARKQHRRAAELADHGSLQQGGPVGLRRAGGRGGHGRRGPEAVQSAAASRQSHSLKLAAASLKLASAVGSCQSATASRQSHSLKLAASLQLPI